MPIIDYYLNGKIRTETWYTKDEDLNNVAVLENIDDLPSYICYNNDDNNSVYIKKWFVNGIAHRDNGPAVIKYYENGVINEETWIKNSKFHRDNNIKGENLPSQITYYEDGKIKDKKWFKEGKYCRDDYSEEGYSLPTYVRYDLNGCKALEIWYHKEEWVCMNALYRFECDKNFKPLAAVISYNGLGQANDSFYFIYNPIDESLYIKILYLFEKYVFFIP
jgi:antitoxin component YwqK of YwqJK toxin-antitoxin module